MEQDETRSDEGKCRSEDDLYEVEASVCETRVSRSVGGREELSDSDAERFAQELIRRAISLAGVKVERDRFFRSELSKYSHDVDVERAIATTPLAAGMTPQQIDKAARRVIEFETTKCSAISFATGIPGGIALAGTVPADLVQYFAHVLRVEQKLAYLYGWQTFLDENDEVDDETMLELVILMGVMLGVGAAATQLSRFAAEVAMPHVAKTIQRKALTKTAWYPLMKKVLGAVGVHVTKTSFAKTAGKVVPVVGGIVSGGLTYASFRPSAERLRKHLRALPVSGISPDVEDEGTDAAAEVLLKASDGADRAASAVKDAAKNAGTAVSDFAKSAGDSAYRAAHGARDFLDSLNKKRRE